MFDTHLLVHTHIPKCAGGSLNRGLKALLGDDRVFVHKNNVFYRNLPHLLTDEERQPIHAYVGHFRHGSEGVEAFGRTPLYVATVREPIDRFISNYTWAAGNPKNGYHHLLSGKDINAAAVALMEVDHPMTVNNQCYRLSSYEDFIIAKTNIDDNYIAVVPHHAVNKLLDIFARHVGVALEGDEHNHARPGEKPVLWPEIEAQLRERTAEDQKLVEWVAQQEGSMLARAEERLSTLLS